MTGLLYHLVRAAEWPADAGAYRPGSLDDEGFIHLSDASQVPATSLRYYGEVADLLAVALDPAALHAPLVWEDLAGHGAFPHLYGPIDPAAVVSVTPYTPGTPL